MRSSFTRMAKMKNTGNKKIKTEGTIVDRSATWQKTFGKLFDDIYSS